MIHDILLKKVLQLLELYTVLDAEPPILIWSTSGNFSSTQDSGLHPEDSGLHQEDSLEAETMPSQLIMLQQHLN